MNILELFAGSRSIGKVADKLGMNVFSHYERSKIPEQLCYDVIQSALKKCV